ncbi:MAG: BPL-N domain-containing protein [Syntrophobacteraceae bacterium]|jgi:hypothetical protein
MKKADSSGASGWAGPPVAVLWTQSLVWGLLCVDTLSVLEVPFRLVSASEICEGCLDAFRILIVPGGWAAHKVRALGETGRLKIAGFIDEGGSYVGFCGGAGLALSSPPALYLTPIRRMPLSERLPSASGEIHICGALSHPAWENIPVRIPVSVWWPSQFRLDAGCQAACLASYADPGVGFQVADLRVGDAGESAGWEELEEAYGINLDPERIKGHPAIIEIEKGKGRLVLSYAHLETPGDVWGNRLFFNILNYLSDISGVSANCFENFFARKACSCNLDHDGEKSVNSSPLPMGAKRGSSHLTRQERSAAPSDTQYPASGISKAKQAAADLIAFGEANRLWNWRKPWLLNWRRGIRGLEYGTLYIALCYMADLEQKLAAESSGLEPAVCGANWPERTKELEEKTLEFCVLAKRLLFEEKIAAGMGTVSKTGKVNEKVDHLRNTLFGKKMNHGGFCGALFDLIDQMLLDLIRGGASWDTTPYSQADILPNILKNWT